MAANLQQGHKTRPGLLIVDDDVLIADTLAFALGAQFEVYTCDSRAHAVELLRQLPEPPELALVDLGLPPTPHEPGEGFLLISELLAHLPSMKIFVLSGQNDAANARHARTLGAAEFVAKPCDPDTLSRMLTRALELRAAELRRVPEDAEGLVGASPALAKLRSQLAQFADSPFPVLIEGESGSGKEVVARSLHRMSRRAGRPFLALNCAAIAPTLVEPTLFGYAKGAFTGAAANKAGYFEDANDGTLFLDEIGELPLEMQAKLLRVLENGEYQRVGETQSRVSRARVVAATNRDLRRAVRESGFRADLYHRLSVLTLSVPALRDMEGDKLVLLDHFRRFYAAQSNTQPFELNAEAEKSWLAYPFPGNVRELRNIVIRLTAKYSGQKLGVAELEPEFDAQSGAAAPAPPGTGAGARGSIEQAGGIEQAMREIEAANGAFDLDRRLHALEHSYLEAAMRMTRRNITQAARLLGVNRTTLYSRLAVDAAAADAAGGEARRDAAQKPAPEGKNSGGQKLMYLDHFGLKEPPFRITPHTDFFFDGADRGATLEALLYAILHDEGIIKVSGEVGSGKTMLCRVLMERLPAHVDTVYVATPSLGRDEILHTIADELKLEFSPGRVTTALRELQEHLIRLYAQGRRVVILIDEAHAMPEETLEQVRLLSNLETNRHKLLQIVLFGQPELDEALARPSLRQLKDRITHSFGTRALNPVEAGRYLSFRMRAAGYRGPEVFTPAAASRIARAAGGLSRRLNILADKSLLAAFAENVHAVTPKQVRRAIKDSEFAPVRRRARPLLLAGGALATGLVLGVLLPAVFQRQDLPVPPLPTRADSPPARQNLAAQAALPAATPMSSAAPASVSSVPQQTESVAAQAAPPQAAAIAASAPGDGTPPQAEPATPPPASPLTQPEAKPLLGGEQLKRIAAYPSGTNRLLRERIAAARDVLEKEPDGAYSIELFQTDNTDAARMERFLVRASELVPLSQVYVVPHAAGGRYRMRVLFGIFPDRDSAGAAEKRLPPRYQKAFQTVPRSFAELRGVL